ncbi:MAG: xanthine dehydrogenase family protein subunit M [Nitrososphaerota archaeon]|nr:xanthine dehydrogenase family protein subunit M [Candidatus Bathyarchaeota archaeon]MDW8023723.1 xanthine dehydrogenase family protein subunit M [Nitrososphaerota archaeon]
MKILKPFKHVSPKTVEEAAALLSVGKAKLMAGGTDLLTVLKDRIHKDHPELIIDLKTIPNLDYIVEDSGFLKIGALAKLAEIAQSPLVKGKYRVLADAAKSVGSPQIRNVGTIGGNLCQEVRCLYYRYPHHVGERIICYRKGGRVCYAVSGNNLYHAILGGPTKCYAVHPSDMAPALIALDAKVKTTKRTVRLEEFFDPLTGTILDSDEVLTEIQVPTPPDGSRQVWIKFRLRKSIDFAIAAVALLLTLDGDKCEDVRIVLGGVAPTPWRSKDAEDAVRGKPINEAVAEEAGKAAVKNAVPLTQNAYKIQVVKALVKRAILSSV